MNKIKSRWHFKPKTRSRREYDKILNSRYIRSIANKIARAFVDKKPECSFDEIRSAALFGFWKAIDTHDPDRGKFATYATHVCQSYIWNYYNNHTSYKKEKGEIQFDENITGVNNNENKIVNEITLRKILDSLNEVDRRVLVVAYINNDISQYREVSKVASILGMTVYGLQLKIKRILKKARKYGEENLHIH